ncbi:MAG: metallophosphoesterase family protein [Desulfurococcaceae archaeon]
MDMNNINPELRSLHEETVNLSSSSESYRSLVEDSINFIKLPPRGGIHYEPGIIELRGRDNYVFIGDLHGDYYTLLYILDAIWDNIDKYTVIFLGDYIDRGYLQIETLVFLLNFKRNYVDKAVLLRGNHEPPAWLIPYPHDYPHVMELRYGGNARELYSLTTKLFDNLPLVAIKYNHFMALHGGPPLKVLSASNWKDAFTATDENEKRKILEEILWSDPTEIIHGYTYNPRGAGILYGSTISQKALQLVKGKVLVRGHEAVNGIKLSHNKRVVTVFTSPLVYGFDCGGVLVYEYSVETGDYETKKLCFNSEKHEMLILNNTSIQ